MFRAGLLLMVRRINSLQTATGIVMPYVDWLLPAEVEAYYLNKLIENSASCWFM